MISATTTSAGRGSSTTAASPSTTQMRSAMRRVELDAAAERRRGDRVDLDGVDLGGPRLGREEGQDPAAGADVDDDISGAHDGADGVAEREGPGLVLQAHVGIVGVGPDLAHDTARRRWRIRTAIAALARQK